LRGGRRKQRKKVKSASIGKFSETRAQTSGEKLTSFGMELKSKSNRKRISDE
jgi:hypothetical protein